jgi:hypothetical protein
MGQRFVFEPDGSSTLPGTFQCVESDAAESDTRADPPDIR